MYSTDNDDGSSGAGFGLSYDPAFVDKGREIPFLQMPDGEVFRILYARGCLVTSDRKRITGWAYLDDTYTLPRFPVIREVGENVWHLDPSRKIKY